MKLFPASLLILSVICGLSSFSIKDRTASLPVNRHQAVRDTATEPVLVPEKVVLPSMEVLTISEIAATSADINRLLNRNYSELLAFIQQKKLQPGKMMAFYYTPQDPLMLDAAIEVNDIPVALTGRIRAILVEGGDAVVVHYRGPYEKITSAYLALANWVKQNNREAMGQPFEAYTNDPTRMNESYEWRADVYQRIK